MDGDLRHYLKESMPVLIRVRLFKLPDIFKSPNFQITRCFQKQQNDENLVQLGFTFHDTVEEISVHMEGDCVLDPNKFWCIRSYSININKKWPNSREEIVQDQFQVNKLHLARSGIPVPAMAVLRTRHQHGDESMTSEMTIECDQDVPSSEHPDSKFTLSAFGLPEPPGVTWERPTPWWLYGIAVGLALVVLSGILFKVFGRLRSQGIKT